MREIVNYLVIILLFFIFIYIQRQCFETFGVVFGTPPETSSADASSMKSLLELGSQAQEDRKYDVVSHSILGEINRESEEIEEEDPLDPKCFNDFYDFDYTHLQNHEHRKSCKDKPSVCCDKPSIHEIDYDFSILDENNLIDDILGKTGGLDLDDCCCKKD